MINTANLMLCLFYHKKNKTLKMGLFLSYHLRERASVVRDLPTTGFLARGGWSRHRAT